MEIVIGRTARMSAVKDKTTQVLPGAVEASVLNVRPPRGRRQNTFDGQNKRGRQSAVEDPAGGRVMVLLIPDGYKIPRDIQSGNYRVFLRFVKRQK